MIALFSVACTDQLDVVGPGAEEGTAGEKGEMVLFAAGTADNSVVTRAGDNSSARKYYMPNEYRFICRMYYKASTGENAKYDVSGNTDVITCMKVRGDVGNSLYWSNSYPTLDYNNESLFDTYGNDAEATCFYWQNRKEHAFLAWTDLNHATVIGYDPTQGSNKLKFLPADISYDFHTGTNAHQWVENGYELYTGGESVIFDSWKDLRSYLEGDGSYGSLESQYDYQGKEYYYAYGWSCKYSEAYAEGNYVDPTHRSYGWIQYQMFYDKLKYQGTKTIGGDIELRRNSKNIPAYLYNKAANKYLAEIEVNFYKTDAEGNLSAEPYSVDMTTLDPTKITDGMQIKDDEDKDKIVAKCVFVYNLTDDYGNVKYDETMPRYTFYYRKLEMLKEQEVIKSIPANVFDLTRSASMQSINDQPDIAQALTIQAPLGATQASNRVNLYFKHQFSQIQVDVKASSDQSAQMNKTNIKKVELLGVTEHGYVFTEIDEDGKLENASYESVDVTNYTDSQLADNPYGTAFEMFDMATGKDENGESIPADNVETHDAGYAIGYLKSYNAIAYGQLQAIRVTWKEDDVVVDGTTYSGIEHKATYKISDDDLRNLKSGYKYIWKIELRRGTLAIVRTEIVDWIVPSNELEYNTNGTITNQ